MMLGRGLYFPLFIIIVALILPLEAARPTLWSNCHNVLDYGAVGDGDHDDTQAFFEAWRATCDSLRPSSTMVVPPGLTFYINSLSFRGPCQSSYVYVEVNGYIVAPQDPENWNCSNNCHTWIEFKHIDGISIYGEGTIDGRGQAWWDLHMSTTPTALKISDSQNVHLSGLSFLNNPRMHVVLDGLRLATVMDLRIHSPEHSPNTDGIHVAHSKYVSIAHSTIGTGDDCISVVNGTSYLQVNDIICGPGHGISIGSLGKDGAIDRVEYINVTDILFNRTTNGARIKTWQGGQGYAKYINFERISVIDADNPIIVNQFYCDREECSNHKDAVKVSDVRFIHFAGTSKGKTAVTLECSETVPCEVFMEDINIRSSKEGESVTSYCTSAHGEIRGRTVPQISCLHQGRD